MCNLGSQLSSNRRRRSGSRTSHGSHGKTLRLSFEQKLGISNKEVERHEANLSHFRSVNFLKIFIHTGLQITVPIAEIISVKNAGVWVSMVSYLKKNSSLSLVDQ